MRRFSAIANLGSILMLVSIQLFLVNAVLLARDGRGFTPEEALLKQLQTEKEKVQSASTCAYCKEKAARKFFELANGKETSGAINIKDSELNPRWIAEELADSLIKQGRYEEAKTVAADCGAKDVMDPKDYSTYFGEDSSLYKQCENGEKFKELYYGEGGVFQTFKSEIETSLEKLEEAKKKLEEAKTKVDELEEEPEKPEDFDPEKPPEPPSEDDEDYEEKKAEYDKEKEKYDKYKEWNTKKEEAEKLLSETEEQFNAIVEELNAAADKYCGDSTGQGYFSDPAKENEMLDGLYEKIKEVGTLANDIKSASDGIGDKLKDDGTKEDFSGREGASELSDRTMRALQKREVGGNSPRLSNNENWADSLGGKACTCGSSGRWEPATDFWPKAEDTAKKEEDEEEKKEDDTPRAGSIGEYYKEVDDNLKKLADKIGCKLPEKGSAAYGILSKGVELNDSEDRLKELMEQQCPQNLYGGENAAEGRKNGLMEKVSGNSEFNDLVKDKVWPPAEDDQFGEYRMDQLWKARNNSDEFKRILGNLKNKGDAKVNVEEGRGGGESDDTPATSIVADDEEEVEGEDKGTWEDKPNGGSTYTTEEGKEWIFW